VTVTAEELEALRAAMARLPGDRYLPAGVARCKDTIRELIEEVTAARAANSGSAGHKLRLAHHHRVQAGGHAEQMPHRTDGKPPADREILEKQLRTVLLNSIGIAQTSPDQVMLSTNVKYAAVQRFGSRDRDSIGFGPRTRAMIIKEDSISLLRVAQTARIERRQEELLQREVDSNVGDLELEIRDREFSIPLEGTVS